MALREKWAGRGEGDWRGEGKVSEFSGRWTGSEGPGRPEVGLCVRGLPPLTSTVAQAGHGLSGLSFPRAWIAGRLRGSRGLVSRGRGGAGAVTRAAQAGSFAPVAKLAARAEAWGPEPESPLAAAAAHPAGRPPGLRGRGGESGPGGLGRRRPPGGRGPRGRGGTAPCAMGKPRRQAHPESAALAEEFLVRPPCFRATAG